jgi:hypothetical protein
MQRWNEYIRAPRGPRRADAIPGREQPASEPPDSEFIGAPWFSEYEPLPLAT